MVPWSLRFQYLLRETMNYTIKFKLIFCLVGMFLASVAFNEVSAQRRGRDPHIAYAYPAGCERGTTLEITITVSTC